MKNLRLIICLKALFTIALIVNSNRAFSQSSIYGRVWDPVNIPVSGGYVLVTDDKGEKLFGETLTLSEKTSTLPVGSFRIENLPSNIRLKVFTFHDKIPSSYGYQEIELKNNESRKIVLDISLSFTDPGPISNPLLRLPTLLKQANLFDAADKVIARLTSLQNTSKVKSVTNQSTKSENKITETRLTDIDGNVYSTVIIGSQTWMQENLRTTKYNDYTNIYQVTDNYQWVGLSTGSFCWYNNDPSMYKSTYGALYNWYAVNTRKLCPTGWHIPSDNEYLVLIASLGGENIAGGKLKAKGTLEEGTGRWHTPNFNATNASGFSGLPGGLRYRGQFTDLGSNIYLWSASSAGSDGKFWAFYFDRQTIAPNIHEKTGGMSVRCVKD